VQRGDDSYGYHDSWWHEIGKREIIYRKREEKREREREEGCSWTLER